MCSSVTPPILPRFVYLYPIIHFKKHFFPNLCRTTQFSDASTEEDPRDKNDQNLMIRRILIQKGIQRPLLLHNLLSKMGLFFFIFVFSIQLTVNKCSIEILPLTGFEVGVGSDRCTNWATNTPLDNNVSFLPYLYKTDTPHHHNALPCAIKMCLPKKLGCCCHDFKRKGSLLFSLDCEVST